MIRSVVYVYRIHVYIVCRRENLAAGFLVSRRAVAGKLLLHRYAVRPFKRAGELILQQPFASLR